MAHVRLQVLGPLHLWVDDVEIEAGPRQQSCLLALLAARANQPVGMSELLELLWASEPPSSAVNVIHKYVGAVRRLLEPGLPSRTQGSWVVRRAGGYRLVVDAARLDLVALREHLGSARQRLRENRPEGALDLYGEGLRLWYGTPGEGLADSVAAGGVFAAIESELLTAVVEMADLALDQQRPEEALPALRRATRASPLNESLHALLVRCLASAGQQADALSAFGLIQNRLRDELGIDPGPDLQRAQQAVLTQSVPPAARALRPSAGSELDEARDGAGVSPRPEVDARRGDHDGHPQVEPSIPRIRPAQLPPDLPVFVGRERELATLRAMVSEWRVGEQTSPLTIAIDGMGGVGKSTLALRFARLVGDEQLDGVLHLDLHGEEERRMSPSDCLRSLLHALGTPAAQMPDTFDALVGLYRSLSSGKRLLLVLEAAHDVAQVRALLPSSGQSLVLITSRSPLLGLAALEGTRMLHVDVPDSEAARDLLLRRLPRLDPAPPRSLVDRVVTLCGRLPLALAVVAARISARPGYSLSSAVEELGDRESPLRAFYSGPGSGGPRTAFSWSYEQLSSAARRLFRLSSMHLCPDITAAASASLAACDLRRTRVLLEELEGAALTYPAADGRFASHVLLKAYGHELLEADETGRQRQEAHQRLVHHYLQSGYNAALALAPARAPVRPEAPPPDVHPETPTSYEAALSWFDQEREVMSDAVRRCCELSWSTLAWQLAVVMQPYLEVSGFHQHWVELARAALEVARRTDDRRGQAHAAFSLGEAYAASGALDDARELLFAARDGFTAMDLMREQKQVQTVLDDVLQDEGRPDLALYEYRAASR